MAWNLDVVVGCDSPTTCGTLAKLLARETRPDFVEDVEERDQALYNAVELLEYPVQLIIRGEYFYIAWHDCEIQVNDVMRAFDGLTDITIKALFWVPDDPLSGDEGEEDEDDEDPQNGYFYVMRDRGLVRVDREAYVRQMSQQPLPELSFEDVEEVLFALARMAF